LHNDHSDVYKLKAQTEQILINENFKVQGDSKNRTYIFLSEIKKFNS